MKLFSSRTPQLLFILLSLFLLPAAVQTRTTLLEQTSFPIKERAKEKPALVCIVSHVDPGEPQSYMDAVVLVSNGKFSQPYPEYNEAGQKKFAGNYFAPGKKYRVTFGGGEVATATVKSWDMGCNSIHAAATVDDNKKIPPHLSALAVDSATLGRKPGARRAPTDAEREGVMRMVRQIYRAHGTTPPLLNTLKTTNLTATDLNGDGEFELIGSFVLETKTPRVNARRDLLLIAERQRPTPMQTAISPGPSFKATLADFQSYQLPPEGFDSAVDFVDQLDLDSDGLAEVFVQEHGFDAYGYSIYKKTNRGWRKVYTTTGDAC
jgi:hypothetical protein